MSITVEQLITPKTSEEALEDVLDIFRGLGFDVDSWQSGGIAHALAAAEAESYVKLYNELVPAATRSSFNDTSTGVALTLKAKSDFDNDRELSITTQGSYTLTDNTGGGPHTIDNTHVFATSEGVTFRVITGGTLPQSGSVTVTIECEQGGSVGNVANGTITELKTALTGVTGTNGVVGGTSWISRTGIDAESDAKLRERNRTKWARLSPNGPIAAYINMALEATNGSGDPVGVTRATVDPSNPNGPGTLSVYLANATATATAQQVLDVQAYIDARKAPGAIVTVAAATEVPINTSAFLLTERGAGANAKLEYEQQQKDYINGLPIGGFQLDGVIGGTGVVQHAKLVQLGMATEGVKNITVSIPNSDQLLSLSEVATAGVIQIEYTEI